MHCWNGFLIASCLGLGLGFSAPAWTAPPAHSECQDDAPIEPRPVDLESLFARFAKIEGLQCAFTEKKYIALLAVPLESRGTIYFMRPGFLTRVVDEPSKSKLTITPDELRLENVDGKEVLDLRKNADLRTFVTSLVRVFAGERESLERSYTMAYELDADDETKWSLNLVPRAKPLTEMVRSLRLEGVGAAVTRIELHEPNGDRTETIVTRPNADRRYTAEEALELFGVRRDGAAQEKSL